MQKFQEFCELKEKEIKDCDERLDKLILNHKEMSVTQKSGNKKRKKAIK